MTVREVYEAVLVEINKVNAATFTVEEFNYMLTKSILAFTNEKYNFFAVNQQLSDDLRVLLKDAKFNYNKDNAGNARTDATYNPIRGKVYSKVSGQPTKLNVSSIADLSVGSIVKLNPLSVTEFTVASMTADTYPYTVTFTSDISAAVVGQELYLKMSNVGLIYDYQVGVEVETSDGVLELTLPSSDYLHILSCRVFWKGIKPNGQGAYLVYGGKRMTFDIQNVIQNNVYMRPNFNRPYYRVHDNTMNAGIEKITDMVSYKAYQNKPKIEVHVGKLNPIITLDKVVIDYIKIPEIVTLNDIDIFTGGADTSQVLEFPDYLKNEIVRRVTDYMLENMGSPRAGSHPQFNQEIPSVPIELSTAMSGNRQRQSNNQDNQSNQ